MHLSVLVGVTDIARLTGQRHPSVVTNWRSRSATFPPDRTAGTQPRFDLTEVIAWLRNDGPRGSQVPEIPPGTWWAMMARAFYAETNTSSGRTRNGLSPRAVLAALVLLRHLSPQWTELCSAIEANPDDGDEIRRLVIDTAHEAEAGEPAAAGLLENTLDVDPATAVYLGDLIAALSLQPAGTEGGQPLLDAALGADTGPRSQPAKRTASELGELMAALASPQPDAVVFDPACGEASLLLSCARVADGPVELHGQERDTTTTQIAAIRLILAGHDPRRLAEPGHDSLSDDQFPELRADVVVLDPPLTDDAAPAGMWIDHARSHLKAPGIAVIAVPLNALVPVNAARRRPDERLKSHLDRLMSEHSLQSAVVVPRGHRTDVTGPIVVLVIANTAERIAAAASPTVPVVLVKASHDNTSIGPAAREIAACMRTAGLAASAARASQHLETYLARTFDELLSHLSRHEEAAEHGPRQLTRARAHTAQDDLDAAELKRRLDDTTRRHLQLQNKHQALKQTAHDLLNRIEALRSEIGEAACQGLAPEISKLHRSLE
jgi:hypothetical protein